MSNRPAPEIAIDEEMVASLLSRQHPDLAKLSISVLDRGWDNTNFRLGDELMVRMPHRTESASLIENEHRWLPGLAPTLPIAISAPERVGEPDLDYPWKWSIGRWFPGATAAEVELVDQPAAAVELGRFLAALHQPAPESAPVNPYRGVNLRDRSAAFNKNLMLLSATKWPFRWTPGVVALHFDLATKADETDERVWLHGDLHAKNIIVHEDKIKAIIDWGDICCGDRAADLIAAWMLVPSAIDVVAETAGADEAAWARAKGWAIHFAVLYLLHCDDDPIMESMGLKLMSAVISGA